MSQKFTLEFFADFSEMAVNFNTEFHTFIKHFIYMPKKISLTSTVATLPSFYHQQKTPEGD